MIYIVPSKLLYNNKDQTKPVQHLFNLSEERYCLFYHIASLQVCSTYSIIPEDFTVKKNPCIGKASKKLISDWEGELINVVRYTIC